MMRRHEPYASPHFHREDQPPLRALTHGDEADEDSQTRRLSDEGLAYVPNRHAQKAQLGRYHPGEAGDGQGSGPSSPAGHRNTTPPTVAPPSLDFEEQSSIPPSYAHSHRDIDDTGNFGPYRSKYYRDLQSQLDEQQLDQMLLRSAFELEWQYRSMWQTVDRPRYPVYPPPAMPGQQQFDPTKPMPHMTPYYMQLLHQQAYQQHFAQHVPRYADPDVHEDASHEVAATGQRGSQAVSSPTVQQRRPKSQGGAAVPVDPNSDPEDAGGGSGASSSSKTHGLSGGSSATLGVHERPWYDDSEDDVHQQHLAQQQHLPIQQVALPQPRSAVSAIPQPRSMSKQVDGSQESLPSVPSSIRSGSPGDSVDEHSAGPKPLIIVPAPRSVAAAAGAATAAKEKKETAAAVVPVPRPRSLQALPTTVAAVSYSAVAAKNKRDVIEPESKASPTTPAVSSPTVPLPRSKISQEVKMIPLSTRPEENEEEDPLSRFAPKKSEDDIAKERELVEKRKKAHKDVHEAQPQKPVQVKPKVDTWHTVGKVKASNAAPQAQPKQQAPKVEKQPQPVKEKEAVKTKAEPTPEPSKKKVKAKPAKTPGATEPAEEVEEEPVLIIIEEPKKKAKKKAPVKKETAEEFDALLDEIAHVEKPQTQPPKGTLNRRAVAAALATIAKSQQGPAVVLRECLSRAENVKHNLNARYVKLQEGFDYLSRTPKAKVPALLRSEFLYEFADASVEMQDIERARNLAEESLALAREENCTTLEMMNLLVIGRCYENLVQPERARGALEEVLSLARSLEDETNEAWALCHLGTVLELLGNFTEAFRSYSRAMALGMKLDDKRILSEVRANVGVAHLSIGELVPAEHRLRSNIELAKALKDQQVLSRVLNNLSYLYIIVGDLEQAREVQQMEYDMAVRQGEPLCMAQAVSALGSAFKFSKEYTEALKCYRRELQHVESSGYRQRLAECYGNIGTTHRLLGQIQQARASHTKELEMARTFGEPMTEAKALNNLGDVDVADNNPHDAIEKYQDALILVECLAPEIKATHLVKVTCTEIEWRAIDGLEAAFYMIGEAASAIQASDRKHLSVLSDEMRKKARNFKQLPAPTDVANYTKQKMISTATINNICELTGMSAVVSYSLIWDDVDYFYAYVMLPGRKPEARKLKYTPEMLFSLGSQSSGFRLLLVGSEFDTPLLPHLLAQEAERAALQCTKLPVTIEEHLAVLSEALILPLADILPPMGTVNPVCFVPDGLFSNVPFHALPYLVPDIPAEKPDTLIMRHPVTVMPSVEALWQVTLSSKMAEKTMQDFVKDGSRQIALKTIVSVEAEKEFVRQAEAEALLPNEEDVSKDEPIGSVITSAKRKLLSVCEAANKEVAALHIHLPTSFDVRDEYGGVLSASYPNTASCSTVGEVYDGIELPQYAAAVNPSHKLLRSEEICEEMDLRRVPLMFHTGFSSFVCRVIHETYITVLRAFFYAGAARHVMCLWTGDIPIPAQRVVDGVDECNSFPTFYPMKESELIERLRKEMLCANEDIPNDEVGTCSEEVRELRRAAMRKPGSGIYARRHQQAIQRMIDEGVPVELWGRLVYAGLP